MRRRSIAAQPAWAATLALLLSVSASTVQYAEATSDSGTTDRSVDTTTSLAIGYEAEHSGTNQVTKQVADARARRAAPQCSSRRSCASASAQTPTTQADNVGAGRVKHAHPSAAPQPDSTVESSTGRLSIGETSSGGTTGTAESQSSITYPVLAIDGSVAYKRTTTTEPNGTGAVSHALSYKADVPVPEHSQEPDSAWKTFGITSPPAGQRICLGNVALSYDTGGELDKMTFTHVTEGSADGSISGVAAGTTVTTIVTTTLDVSVLSGAYRDLANTYAKSVLLSSGAVNVPAASLSIGTPPGAAPDGSLPAILASKASTTQLVVNGTAITDNGGFDALSGSWSTDTLTKDRAQLANQTH
mgnify:FL=1